MVFGNFDNLSIEVEWDLWYRFVERYSGWPLALKGLSNIVADSIISQG
jgi:hypothetical protein